MKRITFVLLSGAFLLSNSISATARPESKPHKLRGDNINVTCPVPGYTNYTYCMPNEGTPTLGPCPAEKPGKTYSDGYCCKVDYYVNDGSSETDIYVLYGPIPKNPDIDNNQLYYKDGEPAGTISCPAMAKRL